MKNPNTLCMAPLLVLLTLPAMAHQGKNPADFEKRLERQENRIEHGIRKGELTRHEAGKLRKRQRKVERMFERFDKDGRLNRKERQKLQAALDRNGRTIKRLKHNDRRRDRGSRIHRRHGPVLLLGQRPYPWRHDNRSAFERHFWSFVLRPAHHW